MFRKPWLIGDMICRNPHRLIGALGVLQDSRFNGNVQDDAKRDEFVKHLQKNDVVSYQGISKGKSMEKEGRKWILALSRLGFVTPALSSKRNMTGRIDPRLIEILQGDVNLFTLSGHPSEITPSGMKFMNSMSNIEEQENLLRAICGYRIIAHEDQNNQYPIHSNRHLDIDGLEKRFESNFSPLHFILDVLHHLSARSEEPRLSGDEFAFFVQTSNPFFDIGNVVEQIVKYRSDWKKTEGDREKRNDHKNRIHSRVSREAFKKTKNQIKKFDLYTQKICTFLHLKSSGLFCSTLDDGITIPENQKVIAEMIREDRPRETSFAEYQCFLMTEPSLPFDNIENAKVVIQDLGERLRDQKYISTVPKFDQESSILDLKNIIHECQNAYREMNELEYADRQPEKIEDIVNYLLDLSKPNPSSKVALERGAPVTLEWAVWSAFLAMGGNPINLRHEKGKSRRFEIDHECLPVRHAPGNGPDMAFEFEDFIIVAEVTLLKGSRQDAAESEPVRRHVAKYVTESNLKKDVYCLFVAPEIDNNMAQSFLGGVWYPTGKDEEMILNIVPVDLKSLVDFLYTQHTNGKIGHDKGIKAIQDLVDLIHDCRTEARDDSIKAPEWKKTISAYFSRSSNIGQPDGLFS